MGEGERGEESLGGPHRVDVEDPRTHCETGVFVRVGFEQVEGALGRFGHGRLALGLGLARGGKGIQSLFRPLVLPHVFHEVRLRSVGFATGEAAVGFGMFDRVGGEVDL